MEYFYLKGSSLSLSYYIFHLSLSFLSLLFIIKLNRVFLNPAQQ